jgi:ubiquinone/menaquinone biosynthesis C-methylase UbiE
VNAGVQRRVQRYGWDLAARHYEPLWQTQLATAQAALLASTAPAAGEQVLDVACGTGLVTLDVAQTVGSRGQVIGIDLSAKMIDTARLRRGARGLLNVSFQRMDAEALSFPDASFDTVLCALGLMYMPDPAGAVREMRRVLKQRGRLGLIVWGERARCGWAELFPIIDAEVASEVCPLFFQLGHSDALAQLCVDQGLSRVEQRRIAATLSYANGDQACDAAFEGGPVALAWSRFDAATRARVRARYLAAIDSYREGERYHIPGEFVIVSALAVDERPNRPDALTRLDTSPSSSPAPHPRLRRVRARSA